MKKIEFRAWNISGERWCYFTLKQLIEGAMFSTIKGTSATVCHCHNYTHWSSYTTKKDTNGKKIFEGDIVTEGGLVAEVRWDDRNARFYYVTSTASVGLYGFVGQVIGDIHTTPELLKEKPQ